MKTLVIIMTALGGLVSLYLIWRLSYKRCQGCKKLSKDKDYELIHGRGFTTMSKCPKCGHLEIEEIGSGHV